MHVCAQEDRTKFYSKCLYLLSHLVHPIKSLLSLRPSSPLTSIILFIYLFFVEEKVQGSSSLERIWLTTALKYNLAHSYVFCFTVMKFQVCFSVSLLVFCLFVLVSWELGHISLRDAQKPASGHPSAEEEGDKGNSISEDAIAILRWKTTSELNLTQKNMSKAEKLCIHIRNRHRKSQKSWHEERRKLAHHTIWVGLLFPVRWQHVHIPATNEWPSCSSIQKFLGLFGLRSLMP